MYYIGWLSALIVTTAFLAGSSFLAGCSTMKSQRIAVQPIRQCGPAAKYRPTLWAAFVRREGEYGILWPGAVYDGEAALGFARSQGVPVESLSVVRTAKGEYLGLKRVKKGRTARAILAEILPEVIASLPFPKTMRWGVEQSRNLMTVRAAAETGMPKVIDNAKKLGELRELFGPLPVELIGQGALGIECRAGDEATRAVLAALAVAAVSAGAFNDRLGLRGVRESAGAIAASKLEALRAQAPAPIAAVIPMVNCPSIAGIPPSGRATSFTSPTFTPGFTTGSYSMATGGIAHRTA